jgi:hypothetical protein
MTFSEWAGRNLALLLLVVGLGAVLAVLVSRQPCVPASVPDPVGPPLWPGGVQPPPPQESKPIPLDGAKEVVPIRPTPEIPQPPSVRPEQLDVPPGDAWERYWERERRR